MQAIKRILLVFIYVSVTTTLFAQNKVDSPVEMDQIYDDLLIKWKNKMAFRSDCTSSNDGLTKAADSVYINRLYSLPTEMELAFNNIVRGHIEMYAGRRRNQVSYMLGETAYYFPLFENILDKEGVPLELKYLPIIESALNPIARSRVGASGLWQFMAATGRIYGLEVNSLVDERLDPAKSTAAAARYLKDMYKIYGDWNLVIAAYNCGPGNVNKAIRRSGGKTDYWAIYPYLPRETRGYVPAFIAATYIMNYYEEHGICPAASPYPAATDTLIISKNIHFEQIAGVLDIKVDEIRKYNPQFKNDLIPGEYKKYTLNLPFKHIASFISNQDSILAYKSQELLAHRKTVSVSGYAVGSTSNTVHRVKRGETLSQIANKYNVTVSQLRGWNDLRNDRLTIGRRISIFKKTNKQVEAVAKNTPTSTGGNITTKTVTATHQYKIKKGDTWSSIAKKHKTTISELKQWNKKSSKSLVAGRSLTIQTTKTVEVEEPVKLMSKPQLMVVKIDPNYTTSLIDNYMNSIERKECNMPTTTLSFLEETEREREETHSNRFLYHKVRMGESINQIATRYKVSKDDIVEWNKLSNTSTRIGQRLLIYLPDTTSGKTVARSEKNSDRERKIHLSTN